MTLGTASILQLTNFSGAKFIHLLFCLGPRRLRDCKLLTRYCGGGGKSGPQLALVLLLLPLCSGVTPGAAQGAICGAGNLRPG